MPGANVRTLRTRRESQRLGADIAALLAPGGPRCCYRGDLGAGKAFLARTVARATLGVHVRVTKPHVRARACVRVGRRRDAACTRTLYRLREPAEGAASLGQEVARLGLRERRAEGAILLVEWGQEAVDALGGEPAFVVTLVLAEDGARTATLSGARAGGIV